jgi:hypothetical protein
MPPSLGLVLQHPAIWRGDQYAKVAVASVPTGFAELDEQLPGGGWPRAALTELLTNQQGIGELRLLAPALAHLSREDKWLVLVAPPHLPYAPGFESLGVDLARLIVVRTRSNGESLWAAERCLRAGTCAAVIAWPGPGSERLLRRLQLAAEEGKSLGVIFGPTRSAANASPAALRIQLNAGRSRLDVQILKRRGGGWAPPLSLELDKEPASLHASLRSDPHAAISPFPGLRDAQGILKREPGEFKHAWIPASAGMTWFRGTR